MELLDCKVYAFLILLNVAKLLSERTGPFDIPPAEHENSSYLHPQ